MKKRIPASFPAIVITVIILFSCSTVPITHRKQLNLIPHSSLLSTSFQQYDEFIDNHDLSKNKRKARVVNQVGSKIKNAVERYFKQHDRSGELSGYKWEFNLVESNKANAFCMPGGKVVVYTGIMEIAQGDVELAVVMSHEIAHAIAQHGNERMSQALLAQLGGVALSEALNQKPEQTRQLWMAAYGLGAEVGVLLPYSRLQESEADRLGLIFMAMAGYDPHAAVDFWQRMAKKQQGEAPPEFLSTHPSDLRRINDIKKHMSEAMKYYDA